MISTKDRPVTPLYVRGRKCDARQKKKPGLQVTFSYYAAFNSLLAKMELIKRVYVSLTRGNFDLEVRFLEYASKSR